MPTLLDAAIALDRGEIDAGVGKARAEMLEIHDEDVDVFTMRVRLE